MVDETRRDTYKHPVATENESPVLARIEEEFKQLIAVRTYFIFYFLKIHLAQPGAGNL